MRIVLVDLRFSHEPDVEDLNVLAALTASWRGGGWSCGWATCVRAALGG